MKNVIIAILVSFFGACMPQPYYEPNVYGGRNGARYQRFGYGEPRLSNMPPNVVAMDQRPEACWDNPLCVRLENRTQQRFYLCKKNGIQTLFPQYYNTAVQGVGGEGPLLWPEGGGYMWIRPEGTQVVCQEYVPGPGPKCYSGRRECPQPALIKTGFRQSLKLYPNSYANRVIPVGGNVW